MANRSVTNLDPALAAKVVEGVADVALRQNEPWLRQLIHTIRVQLWCLTPRRKVIFVDKKSMNVVGAGPQGLMDSKVADR